MQEPVERAERPAENRVGHCPLHDRQRVDVDDRVADPEHAERDDGDDGEREPTEDRERQPEEREPEREVAGQAPARGEDERDEAADEPADADGGVEEPDTRLVEVEQLERRDDDEHVERARDERLRGVEADQRPQGRLAHDRRDPGEDAAVLVATVFLVGARSRGGSRPRRPRTRTADQRNVTPVRREHDGRGR